MKRILAFLTVFSIIMSNSSFTAFAGVADTVNTASSESITEEKEDISFVAETPAHEESVSSDTSTDSSKQQDLTDKEQAEVPKTEGEQDAEKTTDSEVVQPSDDDLKTDSYPKLESDSEVKNGDDTTDLGAEDAGVVTETQKLKGTTKGQPFRSTREQGVDATANSQMFRIPAMITLNNGDLLVAADARWNSTMDAASNLDGLVSYSKDGGATWNWELLNHFVDYSDQTPNAPKESASFIDPALIQGKDGKIYMLVDACPAYVGLQNGGFAANGSGFDQNGNLVIAKGAAGQAASKDREQYTYYIDLDQEAKQSVEIGSQKLTMRPIKESNGTETGMWVDAEFNLYKKTEQNWQKVMCKQADTEEYVQNNVFYSQSEWKIYPTFHIWMRTGEMTGDGIVWSEPEILNIKDETEGFVGICPGRGTTIDIEGKERIIFQVYDNSTGTEFASTIYSDDGGKTWNRGERANNLNETKKSSESQIISLPDGGLRMYSRGMSRLIGYTDSYDGGKTWGKYREDPSLGYCENCMVSFINVDGYLQDDIGNIYGNLVMASYPKGDGRNNGVVRVGSINENNIVTWLNDADVRYEGKYLYSCLTQKQSNQIGLLYETEDQPEMSGWGWIVYDDFKITDLLGDGWIYSESMNKPVSEKITGITKEQPFVPSKTGASQKFRIPALITLNNGWLLSAADARWRFTADAASNLDGLVSVSKDGGKTWEWELINHFADFPDETSGRVNMSASFIDPALIQAQDGTIYFLVDACPAKVGLQGGICGNESTGFNEDGNLVIAKGKIGEAASVSASEYTYYIDSKAPVDAEIAKQTKTLYPIKNSDSEDTDVFVDGEYNLYEKKQNDYSPMMCKQMDTGKEIQNNVFYSQSEWKIYPTFHIWMRTAKVNGEKLEWSEPQILNVKQQGEGFVGVCPGRGLEVTKTPSGKNRILFQVYDNATGTELASTVYTEDNGKTWYRGEHTNQLQDTGKSSESQTILLPNGDVRMYSRNSIGYISYADSKDGGKTWGESKKDENLPYVGNCMVSFINAKGVLIDSNGNVYENLLVASYPRGDGRNNGVIRVGSIDAKTNQVKWLNDDEIRFKGSFLYSCLTQNEGNQMSILFEKEDTEYGTGYIKYEPFYLTDLLPLGWNYLQSVPEKAPSISIKMEKNELFAGEKLSISANLTNTTKNTTVQWTVSGEGNAIELSKTTTTDNEPLILTAKQRGRVTLTAVATVLVGEEKITMKATQRVYVSDKNTVTVPDKYDNNSLEKQKNVYLKQQNQLQDGTYTIYSTNGQRLLYFAKGSATTNQVTPTIKNDELLHDKKFDVTKQTWKIKKKEQGFVIESCDENGKYLNITGATNEHLPVSKTPTYFQIEDTGDGNYSMSANVNGTIYYVYFEKYFGATEDKQNKLQFYKDTQRYVLTQDGLRLLIDDAEKLNQRDYTSSSWATFAKALETAKSISTQTNEIYFNENEAKTAFKQVENTLKTLYNAMKNLKKADTGSSSGGSSSGGNSTTDKTETVTNKDGSVTKIVVNKDGSKTKTTKFKDGSVLEIAISKNGKINKEIKLSQNAIDSNSVVTLPVEDMKHGEALKINFPTNVNYAKVKIPAVNPTVGTVAVIVNADGTEEIVKTSVATKNGVKFKVNTGKTVKIIDNSKVFTDVSTNYWGKDAVTFASSRELFNGTSKTEFTPEGKMNRAMVVTVLARLSGEKTDNGLTWYEVGVNWAKENGISDGTNLDNSVSREQLATMLYRYAGSPKVEVSANNFSDSNTISPWANDAMTWAINEGLISGMGDGTVNPQGEATRAQVATMIQRFVSNMN